MAQKIYQIHDKLLKAILFDKVAMREFFEAFLPEPVKRVVDSGYVFIRPWDLRKHLPIFELIFKNIQHYHDDQIKQLGTGLFTSSILAQKYGQQPEELKKDLIRFSIS